MFQEKRRKLAGKSPKPIRKLPEEIQVLREKVENEVRTIRRELELHLQKEKRESDRTEQTCTSQQQTSKARMLGHCACTKNMERAAR